MNKDQKIHRKLNELLSDLPKADSLIQNRIDFSVENNVDLAHVKFDRYYKNNILARIFENSSVMLDLGAKSGKEARKFLKYSTNAQIYAFEPHPEWFAYLKKRFRKHSNCHFYNLAISDKDGSAKFYLDVGKQASTLRKPTALHKKETKFKKKSIKVKCSKLDTWYAKSGLGTIDFLWSDVEGSERELINGAKEVLKNTKYFYAEYSEKEYCTGQALLYEIIEMTELRGFEMVDMFPWYNPNENEYWHFGDILFKNKERQIWGRSK